MNVAEGTSSKSVDRGGEPTLWGEGFPQTRKAFGCLVETFKDRIVRHAFRRLGDLQLAEDVAQDVFVRTYQNRSRLRDVRNVSAYLYKAASNLCIDVQRSRRGAEAPLDEAIVSTTPAPNPTGLEAAAAWDEILRIEAMLRLIPQDQAEVIRLRVFDDLTFRDIGAIKGCPTATVKSRFRYGLEKVRELLGKGKEV